MDGLNARKHTGQKIGKAGHEESQLTAGINPSKTQPDLVALLE
jgi:hypothetical protein